MKTVLVVDDEMDMRMFISTVFEINGYKVVSARDGVDGLKKARELKPDAIILDLMMPGEGGVQMYQRLKGHEGMRHIPVVMLSGVGRKTFFHYLKMMNIRPDESIPEPEAYLEKPPSPELLLSTVKSILGE